MFIIIYTIFKICYNSIFKECIQYIFGKQPLLFHKINNDYIALSNIKDKQNFIYSKMNKSALVLSSKGEKIEFIGYTILYSQELDPCFRQCLSFDYKKMVEQDKVQLRECYLDEHLAMII